MRCFKRTTSWFWLILYRIFFSRPLLPSTPEAGNMQSIFLELMEELLNPVRSFMIEEEAAFYHQKIDCMFPASGVLGKKGRLKKCGTKLNQK